jgi:hypothetical protein
MSKKSLVPVNVLASGVEPAGQHAGDLYFDTETQSLKLFNGVVWIEFLAVIPGLDGGLPSTVSFASSLDGGAVNQVVFEGTISGGAA